MAEKFIQVKDLEIAQIPFIWVKAHYFDMDSANQPWDKDCFSLKIHLYVLGIRDFPYSNPTYWEIRVWIRPPILFVSDIHSGNLT